MNITKLDKLSKEARKRIIKFHYETKRSHVASSLSCVDILVHLYFNTMKKEDVCILSKGHAASALYAVLEMKGFDIPKPFPCHPERNIKAGVYCSTGSLGHGLSIACGVAIASSKKRVFVILSDGELNEGSTWEAIMFAGHHKLKNLVCLLDCNGWQASGKCEEIISLKNKMEILTNFNWAVASVNNPHSHKDLKLSFAWLDYAQKKFDYPYLIKLNSIKGKGLICGEDSNIYHYKSPEEKDLII